MTTPLDPRRPTTQLTCVGRGRSVHSLPPSGTSASTPEREPTIPNNPLQRFPPLTASRPHSAGCRSRCLGSFFLHTHSTIGPPGAPRGRSDPLGGVANLRRRDKPAAAGRFGSGLPRTSFANFIIPALFPVPPSL